MTHTPPHEPPELAGRRILLGLTGSVACYKAAELCRLLTQAGARVQVAMSEGAQHFITAATMQALSGQPVFTSQWDERPANGMAHIQLGREADAILVAPASADFLARLAAGRADDLLSLLCLARPRERAPLLLAPAMNREMWSHPATQRNVRQAAADGARVLAVGFGAQACGETGDGRMLQAPELLEEVIAALTPQTLAGRRVVVTAGPTFEAIDPVRGLTNRSSGKMGFAIARAARLAASAHAAWRGAGGCGIGPANASRLAARTARSRCADCRRRRGRLARRRSGRAEDEKRRQRPAAAPALCGKP